MASTQPPPTTSQPTSSAAAAAAAATPQAPEQSNPKNSSRTPATKLRKKPRLARAGSSNSRRVTMDLPARLMPNSDEEAEDSSEEHQPQRPHDASQLNPSTMFVNMNQSIFGLIAAAGSTVDFTDRFEGQSSDSEDDDDEVGLPGPEAGIRGQLGAGGSLARTTLLRRPEGEQSSKSGSDKHRRKLSEHKLLRSLPALPRLGSRSRSKGQKKEKSGLDQQAEEESEPRGAASTQAASTSQGPSSSLTAAPQTVAAAGGQSQSIEVTRDEGRNLAPVMSRMLEARAEMQSRPSFDLERTSGEKARSTDEDDADLGPSPLAKKLMEIFQFEAPEEVIAEYPCWLLQSVLLQGYMYITAKHICFYSYLPRKSHDVARSGYLSKCGKRNPKYNRYWFRLKGDVLSYYVDPANLYFPSGNIDLRYAISASIDKDKEGGLDFVLVTHQRTFHFRADSAPSAKEWVKSLQRVIFRSHNDGDSVKISLPIDNVIDLEESQMVEFAETCKIRVIDNDETYAIDEYFFSFFGSGKEALNVLRVLIEDSSSAQQETATDNKRLAPPGLGGAGDGFGSGDEASSKRSSLSLPAGSRPGNRARSTGRLQESVRATLVPVSPHSSTTRSPRASVDYPARRSFDAIRQVGSRSRRSLDLSRLSREASPRRSFSADRRRSSSRHAFDRRGPDAASRERTKQGSTDSYVQSSMDNMDQSMSALVASSSDDPVSASQMLRGSEVFHSPTIGRSVSENRIKTTKDAGGAPTGVSGVGSHVTQGGHVLTSRSGAQGAAGGHEDEQQAGKQQQADANKTPVPPTTPKLQNLTRIGAYPLQRAGAFADYLNKTAGKRMSNLLAGAGDAMGYVEKVSGMWKGGRRHYDEPLELRATDRSDDGMGAEGAIAGEDEEKVLDSMERFRAHFALPESERLQATYFGYMMRVLPLYGKIYVSNRSFCFRSLLPGTRTKLILPLRDIENVDKEKGFRFGYSGLVVVIRGHEELFFEFGQAAVRDDCAITVLQMLDATRYLREDDAEFRSAEDRETAELAMAERDALNDARRASSGNLLPQDVTMRSLPVGRVAAGVAGTAVARRHQTSPPALVTMSSESPTTILFDDPRASFLNFKPAKPLRITCLTIGSRGDVQPYIALCKGLLAEGHSVRIATHAEFRPWIESHGIGFSPVEGDPGELMRICIENGTFTYQFLRKANARFRGWLDELLLSAWQACQDTDLLIESPSAMAGIHIAEALCIPYFRAFTMPWTRTRAYPHAFVVPEHRMGGAYNYITYVMFDNIFWKATAQQVNRWRNTVLGLPNTNLEKMQPNKVPFLYNFSPSVVAPPLDYSDWIRVTGYWFLDEGGANWTPPKELADFIAQARKDEKKLVYVGFGSIIVPDPARLTRDIIEAVERADVRCILSKGWSDRPAAANNAPDGAEAAPAAEIPLPPSILQIKSAPHDWLFRQVDAAAHHGGSGTTGASLRAGIPTIARPFFGDQFFFGNRVEDMGVGICIRRWSAATFARALWEATHSERIISRARALGEQIRKENGVDTAIQCIYRDLEYATSLVRAKTNRNQSARAAQAEALAAASGKNTSQATASSTGGTATTSTTTVTEPSVVVGSADAADDDVEDDDEEESWTFVGRQPEDGDLGPATFVARQNLDEVVVRKTEALARDNTVGTTRSDH